MDVRESFATSAQQHIFERVVQWSTELYGELAKVSDSGPYVSVVIGSAMTSIAVVPRGESDAYISVKSWVATSVSLTPELLYYLLRLNEDLNIGAFGLDNDNDIVLHHCILGATCDKEELRASLGMISRTADEFDDRIVSRWGGKRAVDR